jgi:NADH-quinone oxidoreductase subunit M
MQFVENVPWIERFERQLRARRRRHLDALVLLTTFLTPLVVDRGLEVIETRPAQYFAAFLILEGLMIGTFAATTRLLFLACSGKPMLVPMFIIIGVWGGAAARVTRPSNSSVYRSWAPCSCWSR